MDVSCKVYVAPVPRTATEDEVSLFPINFVQTRVVVEIVDLYKSM